MAMEGIGDLLKRRRPAPKTDDQKPSHLPGIETPVERKKEKYLHSPEHVLAAEISRHFSEREKFSAYLAVIRRIGIARARATFAEIKSGDINANNPRRFFMWLSKSDDKPVAARKKPQKKQLDMKRFFR